MFYLSPSPKYLGKLSNDCERSYANLVPAFDGRLSLKYSYQHDDKTLTVEGGYMAAIYINALANYVPSTTVPAS